MKPSERKISVVIGSSELRSACRRTTCQVVRPLARAVST